MSGIEKDIQKSLSSLKDQDFLSGAGSLLDTLGYRSDRTGELSGEVAEFIRQFPVAGKSTKSEQQLIKDARSVHIVFQVTDEEISSALQQNRSASSQSAFDSGLIKSFVFFAVELKSDNYSRGQYAQFTREINKRLRMPTIVLFRTKEDILTLALVHRRQHKRRQEHDVLGSVFMIRDIKFSNTHHAHRNILAELSLPKRLEWMNGNGKPRNFDGLFAAWLDALDTEELNSRFYQELYGWYERAREEAKFPEGTTQQNPDVKHAEHVIRLITRLLFIWFIKEKGLVAEELFAEAKVKTLLKKYDSEPGDSYYRVVLQNLFFAVLNTEIDKREFSKAGESADGSYLRYCYKKEMADSDRLLELFAKTPFINGGLFDCLGSAQSTGDGGNYIDCFSDDKYRSSELLSIPDRLFFDEKGLIPLFNRYKFTVEENTPIEQDVALDPELLGKVFENLLASYNPETGKTARKKTGSYYTPRQVVDYMVDEALINALANNKTADFQQEQLRKLMDYEASFNDDSKTIQSGRKKEIKRLIKEIAEIKVLDPAVGSGAFPMSVLHKLTMVLRRLDPDNSLWEELQKERAKERASNAFDYEYHGDRDFELSEISSTFEKYRKSDFGRKLYLIQNSIYGVDIQPIACQIVKLRFFISLAIEQKPTKDSKDNYGIRPLPNLETRFVAADSLQSLRTPKQGVLPDQKVEELVKKLRDNRERYFHATTRSAKLECRELDAQLRKQLSEELRQSGSVDEAQAQKIVCWNPYDQDAKADWFDATYMFGVNDGFNIVIGNPPYIQLQGNKGEMAERYKGVGYDTFVRSGDIYQLFFELGCRVLLPEKGILVYITSKSWLAAKYGCPTRNYFAGRHSPLRLLEMGTKVFKSVIVNTSILIMREGKSDNTLKGVVLDGLPESDKPLPPDDSHWVSVRVQNDKPWLVAHNVEQSIMNKMNDHGSPLKDWDIDINSGIKTGYNPAFIVDNATKKALIAEDPDSAELLKPILRGRDIERYRTQWTGQWWIIYSHTGINIDRYPAVKRHLSRHRPSLEKRTGGARRDKHGMLIVPYKWYELQVDYYNKRLVFMRDKLVWADMATQGRFAYFNEEMYCNNKAFVITGSSLKYLCAFLNSTLVTWFVNKTATKTTLGQTQWLKYTVLTIPIPIVPAENMLTFDTIIDKVIADKTKGKNTSNSEAVIDKLVYKLYDLSDEEIKYVAGLR